MGKIVIRIHPDDTLFDILARIAAARISECTPLISINPDEHNEALGFVLSREGKEFSGNAEILIQSHADLIAMIPDVDRIRYAAPDRVARDLYEAAAETGFYIARAKVVMEGRVELLHYYREQSVCNTYHRYGNIGEKAFLFDDS